LLLAIIPGFFAQQIVNAYAKVTAINSQTLSLSDVNENYHSFQVNDLVIIMQMQDNVIGDTNNNSSFGNLGSIKSTGLYEIRTIAQISESSGVPTSIVLGESLNNSYNTSKNSSLQIISFPTLGNPHFSTSADIEALDWNGNVGGILAFQVDSTLTLNHNLITNNRGFQGGARDISTSGSCNTSTFISSNTNAFAAKGESIYKNTNSNWVEARGKMLNAGGGANEHNGGGGGGGNFTSGGDGGVGYNCTSGSVGGIGGIALGTFTSSQRLFMGGGGGGGEGNDNLSTDGGDGGGIIIVKANQIETKGNCGNIKITSKGENSDNAGNDGAGGAGAGGSIILQVNNWDIESTCPLIISANGGDGGNVGSGSIHGAGGGGGQGVVIYTDEVPSTNVTTETLNGIGGCNDNSTPCTSTANDAGGADNTGLLDGNDAGPLPVELDYFNVIPTKNTVYISWRTLTEVNNKIFEVERSKDGVHWETILNQKGAGNSNIPKIYKDVDHFPLSGTSYYRLRQTDFDGQTKRYGMLAIEINADKEKISVFPNPTTDRITLKNLNEQAEICLKNMDGKKLNIDFQKNGSYKTADLSSLKAGIYLVEVRTNENIQLIRLIKN
ncbi:MAG: T9SS type A sorting domain-containing protein, partial [Vicingaceae bacterium]